MEMKLMMIENVQSKGKKYTKLDYKKGRLKNTTKNTKERKGDKMKGEKGGEKRERREEKGEGGEGR